MKQLNIEVASKLVIIFTFQSKQVSEVQLIR